MESVEQLENPPVVEVAQRVQTEDESKEQTKLRRKKISRSTSKQNDDQERRHRKPRDPTKQRSSTSGKRHSSRSKVASADVDQQSSTSEIQAATEERLPEEDETRESSQVHQEPEVQDTLSCDANLIVNNAFSSAIDLLKSATSVEQVVVAPFEASDSNLGKQEGNQLVQVESVEQIAESKLENEHPVEVQSMITDSPQVDCKLATSIDVVEQVDHSVSENNQQELLTHQPPQQVQSGSCQVDSTQVTKYPSISANDFVRLLLFWKILETAGQVTYLVCK